MPFANFMYKIITLPIETTPCAKSRAINSDFLSMSGVFKSRGPPRQNICKFTRGEGLPILERLLRLLPLLGYGENCCLISERTGGDGLEFILN